jgi:peroxiredoxin
MSKALEPGMTFPDVTLPDETGVRHRLSTLQGDDMLVLHLSRGEHCPRERMHHRELLRFHEWCSVAFTQLVSILPDTLHDTYKLKAATGAHRTFLADEELELRRALEIDEYTDTHHDNADVDPLDPKSRRQDHGVGNDAAQADQLPSSNSEDESPVPSQAKAKVLQMHQTPVRRFRSRPRSASSSTRPTTCTSPPCGQTAPHQTTTFGSGARATTCSSAPPVRPARPGACSRTGAGTTSWSTQRW